MESLVYRLGDGQTWQRTSYGEELRHPTKGMEAAETPYEIGDEKSSVREWDSRIQLGSVIQRDHGNLHRSTSYAYHQ